MINSNITVCPYDYLCDYKAFCTRTEKDLNECRTWRTFHLMHLAGQLSAEYIYPQQNNIDDYDDYDPCRRRGFWDGRY